MNATPTNTAARLDVPIDAVVVPPDSLRRTPASEQQDEGSARCVAQLGVIQPILVRPGEAPGTFRAVDGRRRLAAARAAGLSTVPVEVRADLSDADAAAVEMAANIQRAAMAPLDQWRAILRLQELGWSDLSAIADALGLPVRLVQRLDRLGRLHPDVLAAIEADEMPPAGHLATIAAAPAEVQARASLRQPRRRKGAVA